MKKDVQTMQRLFVWICLIVLIVSGTADAQSAPPRPSVQPAVAGSSVPPGTRIRVALDEDLNGYRDIAGSAVRFRVVRPVFVAGKMVVDKGDTGIGVATDSGDGVFNISLDTIGTFCGGTLAMRNHAIAVVLALAAPEGGRSLAPGVSSQIRKGTEYDAVTQRAQEICNTK